MNPTERAQPQLLVETVPLQSAQAAAETTSAIGEQTLLSLVLAHSAEHTAAAQVKPSGTLDQFLASENTAEQLQLWFGEATLRRQAHAPAKEFIEQLQRDIAKIDATVSAQLNAVLHHPAFQRLEASWRGLQHLVVCKDRWGVAPIEIGVLNVSWAELRKDLEGANDYDRSAVFKKVYDEGIGMPGGKPFSTLVLDFAIHPRSSREHPFEDIDILKRLAQVAQAAFCPIITNAHPSMFSEERFSDLRPYADYEKVQNELTFLRWKAFRDDEAARFVSLAMPSILMRRPYRASGLRHFEFGFEETVQRTSDYLWGGAAFAVGEVILRAFAQSHWLADIRGAQRGVESGGLVLGPTYDAFTTEPRDGAAKPITEAVITDGFERSLAKLGFLPLCACKDMPMAAFYSSTTVQKPRAYNRKEATANSRLSAMLNYMLCASRFAHYVKVITRNRVGSCSGPEQLENILQNWLAGYICDADADARIRAEKPLRDAQVKVRSVLGSPGEYTSELHLSPHYEFEGVSAAVVLKDEKLVRRARS
jgi:type VI secretion system ImpC/EvpB family protein